MEHEQDNVPRRDPRIPVAAPVRIATIDPETDPDTGRPFFRSSSEICANLSNSGLFIRTAEPLEAGRRILVEVKLPDGIGVEAVGRIAWVKKPLAHDENRGIGVELLGGVPDQLAALRRFVAQQARSVQAS